MNLILGSQSKGRAQVLAKFGYAFKVMHSSIDEKAIRSDNYEELPLLIARAKASALLPLISEPALLITADLVLVCNGELREKPHSLLEAERFLKSYSENVAKTITAVVVTNTHTGSQKEGVDIASVHFKKIPDSIIQQILEKGEIMYGAGALIVEDPLITPYIDWIEGDMDSVIGLPMKLLRSMLSKM